MLELAPEDYEVDEERSALLLRRLPPGLPTWAREVLQTLSPCQQSANTGELSSGNTRPMFSYVWMWYICYWHIVLRET